MLIDFSVENFRSIKEMQTLSMSAANIVSKYKELDEQNIHKYSDKVSLLKTKAIYGANASGKSNMIQALQRFIMIVGKSVKDDDILNYTIENFQLSTETENKQTFFQLSFLLNNIYYRYGFEATKEEIKSEWLFGTPGKKEVPFFTREGKNIVVNETQFKEGKKVIDLYSQSDNDIARNNSLFLGVVKSFGGNVAKDIVDYVSSILVVNHHVDSSLRGFAENALDKKENKIKIAQFLNGADVGIEDIDKIVLTNENDTSNDYFIKTAHKKFNKDLKSEGNASFEMKSHESEGTKKMFELSPLVFEALKHSSVLIIDEFDTKLHPLLSKKIVELFNSYSNKGSQLIFATHDTNLLSAKLMRRDQICFAEKDKYGASHFYSLADFKGVRNDASFEKDYIAGKYGAIPFLGDFSAIIES